MRHLSPILFFLISLQLLSAQSAPFSRGVNLTNWFQVASPRQIQFTKYTKKDFEQIQSLGCDVIRLPINLHFMTNGAPDYTVDPLFLSFLDQAVNWAEELGIHLILDNHTFDPAANTDPSIGNILEKIWPQVAAHYKDRSNFLYFEVLNEPHGISDQQWNAIQQRVVAAIRAVDDKHTIIVGPAGWNSYHNLAAMPMYEDDNLIYTFHFYDPFLFTHQGASWTTPSMEPLGQVPFPYQADQMPPFPASLRGTWIESAFNNYRNDGTVARVKELIDIAVRFQQSRNVPIFCGEFGVYIPNSNPAERVQWYEIVRRYLEEKNIPWTIWDYHGGFGLFEAGGNDLFDHDLNVPLLEALGLQAPPQTAFEMKPSEAGFFIYSDYIGEHIVESSYNDGLIDFYSKDEPNNGQHCIYWSQANQYNHIGFDFKPNRDLSLLVANAYALDFLVRGDTPGATIDLRFIDTKTSNADDRPWRIRITLEDDLADWDKRWHHVHIPLKDFTEQGAWDNGWFNPQGKFDWKAIDRFEIVAEHHALGAAKLWFDNIQITELDTAMVYITTPFDEVSSSSASLENMLSLDLFPNPTPHHLFLQATAFQVLTYQLHDLVGRQQMAGTLRGTKTLDLSNLPPGMYLLSVSNGKNRIVKKILKE